MIILIATSLIALELLSAPRILAVVENPLGNDSSKLLTSDHCTFSQAIISSACQTLNGILGPYHSISPCRGDTLCSSCQSLLIISTLAGRLLPYRNLRMGRRDPLKITGGRSIRVYRFFFLFVEPFSALVGSYYAFFQQNTYLHLTHAPSAPKQDIPVSTQIVLTQLSNLYLLFALNEALVLRATSDLRVWRAVLFVLLIADIGHLYSVNALGSHVYWNMLAWNAIDWGNIGFVYVGAMMRISFLLCIG